MTTFISQNAAALPDILPTTPLAIGAAAGQQSLLLSYSWANNPGFIGVRANGTAVNPLPPKKDDPLAVFGSGGYVGSGLYNLGAGASVIFADEDWSPVGTGTYIALTTRSKGQGTLPTQRRMHITSDGITINDANGNEPTGGRLGAGTLNLAGAIALNGVGLVSTASGTPWTLTDQSGAGLVFTNVSAQYWQNGPLVYAYGTMQYPVTVSGANAKISVPVAVPNQTYAQGPCATNVDRVVLSPVPATSTAQFFFNTLNQTNVGLSNLVIVFMLIYPAS